VPGSERAVGDVGSKEVSPERGRSPDGGESPKHGKEPVDCQLAVKKGTGVTGIGNIKDGFAAIVLFDPY
jgi:hypothetical protein